MFLRNFGATCYYETRVLNVTSKPRCNMLLLISGANVTTELQCKHVATKPRCNMLLLNSGETFYY